MSEASTTFEKFEFSGSLGACFVCLVHFFLQSSVAVVTAVVHRLDTSALFSVLKECRYHVGNEDLLGFDDLTTLR